MKKSGRKTVFISGSNRGIGKAAAENFAENGWDIIAHSRTMNDEFMNFTERLELKHGVSVTQVFFDMTDEEAMKEQIKSVISKEKRNVDALVNNAGICNIGLFMMTPMSAIRDIFEVNLFSHMRLTQLILKKMPVGSSIVNVASIDGITPNGGESGYAASKAAMISWTEVLARELVGKVRVNAVAPHAVNTSLARAIEKHAPWKGKKILEPEEVGTAIYMLASENAAGITGAVLRITGEYI